MTTLTPEYLTELERLCEAATEGVWEVSDCVGVFDILTYEIGDSALAEIKKSFPNAEGNAHFIAASRTALPLLIARVRELEVALAGCKIQSSRIP